MSFPSFKDFYNEIKQLESLLEESESFSVFLDKLNESNLNTEEILLSNFSNVISHHQFSKDVLCERAPKGKKAEDFILANKEPFKKRYGKPWERILYATAWKLFPED